MQYSPEYRVLVECLKSAVEEAGVTQSEIAHQIGKPRAYVWKVLHGYQAPTLVELRAILRASNVHFLPWVARVEDALQAHERANQSEP